MARDNEDILDKINRLFYENVSNPVVGTAVDSTVGLMDLLQMLSKSGLNKVGVETEPFAPAAPRLKQAMGVSEYDPYAPAAIGSSLIGGIPGVIRSAVRRGAPAEVAGALAREGQSFAAAEGGQRIAEEAFPDSDMAGILGAVAGGTTFNTVDNLRGGSSAPPATTSQMAVKNKGGNWLPIEDELYNFKRRFNVYEHDAPDAVTAAFYKEHPLENYYGFDDPDLQADFNDFVRETYGKEAFIPPQDAALNRWIDQKLGKYVQNEMGTPEDPLRVLADRGIAYTQGLPEPMVNRRIWEARNNAGFPPEGFAQTPLGQAWEQATDRAVETTKAREILSGGDPETDFWLDPEINHPWLEKVPPDTPVYFTHADSMSDDLQFGHLLDEMRNAMAPNSTLPERLRIDPNKLDRMSVPQIAEKVSDINRWRAQEAARSEREGMLNNLQAAPRLDAPDLDLTFTEKPGGKWVDIPDTRQDGLPVCTSIGKSAGWCTMEAETAKSYGSGNNRLTALLDADGRPHVQAMISTADDSGARRVYEEPEIRELKPVGNSFNSDRARTYAERDPAYREKITQQVLEFLNGGDWGHVNDLQNYDIVDTMNHIVEESPYRFPGPRFTTQDQWDKFIASLSGPKFARGGPVTLPPNYSKGRRRLL